ncbi:hypothetical protein PT974_03465 [Cladobotryum mycophilum]|uniref:Uncharacterized protein n=1 Tax=Cladobotryum mycophilum TaxID=491253 RepID=A0ABR0SSZ5_9HYPO
MPRSRAWCALRWLSSKVYAKAPLQTSSSEHVLGCPKPERNAATAAPRLGRIDHCMTAGTADRGSSDPSHCMLRGPSTASWTAQHPTTNTLTLSPADIQKQKTSLIEPLRQKQRTLEARRAIPRLDPLPKSLPSKSLLERAPF